ncbi:hypothetical protein HKX48_006512 [Thoreauomyces humboldtii]|nr:hypothetical protein HKX48_006512 [Thoreauomyces humboldtii]
MWKHSMRETSRQKSQFCIGCCSVCLVVFAVAVLMTTMAITPVIFLSLAEKNSGETDLTVYTDYYSGYNQLNWTLAQSVLSDQVLYTYNAPRVNHWATSFLAPKNCLGWNPDDPENNAFTYSGPPVVASDDAQTAANKAALRAQCSANPDSCIGLICSKSTQVYSWLIDTNLEKEYGIGREWTLPPVPIGSVYLGTASAKNLGLGVGDSVIMSYDTQMFGSVFASIKASSIPDPGSISDVRYVNALMTISAIYQDDGTNKFPGWARTGFNGVLEYGTILESIAPFLHPIYPASYHQAVIEASRNHVQYGLAGQIVFACDKPRTNCYQDSNYGTVATRVLSWASDIRFRLGFNLVDASPDTLTALSSVSTFSQFLSLITSIVVALFVGLSCFLIYNLLMVSVETKTFELGILRMIGQTRAGTVHMILIQAATYSIPAWAIGLVLAQVAFIPGKRFIQNIANIEVSARLTSKSVAVATVLGILVPAIAAILPIRQALSGNLRDSLDKRHSKVKPVMVTIERSGPGSLSSIFPVALTGAILAGITFSIYYLVPKALVENNLALLFDIFMALLLGMLLGMVMLSFNVQPIVEKVLLTAMLMFVFFENAAIHSLVAQNLVAHRMRNRKTATMFAFSMAFIIFLSVNLSVELNGLEFSKMQSLGAQIQITDTDASDGYGIPAATISVIEETLINTQPFVVDWAFSSASILSSDDVVEATQVANMGRIVDYKIAVYAVSPNWFNIPLPASDVYILAESNTADWTSGLSVSEQLYAYQASSSAAISTILRQTLAITQTNGHSNFSDTFLYQTTLAVGSGTVTQNKVLSPAAFISSAPYTRMTKFPTSSRTAALVSFPTYLDLHNGRLDTADKIPIQCYRIALDTSVPDYAARLATLVSTLNDVITGTSASLDSLDEELDSIESSRKLLSTIFNLATVLVMLITLFSLNGCMYTNITEQGKELGVLRALGVTKWGIFRIYTYEAFVLTSAAGLLGSLIGAAIGWSMAAQRAVMTQTPVGFPFPWDLSAVALCTSVISSLISTSGPVYGLVGKKKIVAILRE